MQTSNEHKLHTITDYEIRDFVGVFPEALHPDYCQLLIDHYERVQSFGLTETRQKKGTHWAPPLKKDDETYLMRMGPDMLDRCMVSDQITNATELTLAQNFVESAWQCYLAYAERYPGLESLGRHTFATTFKIQKTHPGKGYHIWHCESSSISVSPRVLLVMLYLNTVNEGGETEFLEQGIRVPPRQGTVMICPAHFTHLHRGNPPLSNTKYALTTWISLQE